MVLILHIIVTLLSLVVTGFAYLSPTKTKLNTSYGLVISALASGVYLSFSMHAPMLQGCTSGLVYLSITFFGIAMARRKLATAKISSQK